ncbi:flagellar assembly protein A [Desulfotomaculum nigrificans]|uniref:flagellar assembly protein A n=1 Tax=Desulfotomaculum nigrificans TaxID=1565 RepID=UPI0001FAE79E|nr:flagellar assembly protein A [Desulfotomaculum nigrificans]
MGQDIRQSGQNDPVYHQLINKVKEFDNSSIIAQLGDMARSLLNALYSEDEAAKQHSQIVAFFAMSIARKLELKEDDIKLAYLSGLLHDIGKLSIENEILCKPDKLNEEEYNKIKLHSTMGASVFSQIPQLKDLSTIIEHRHERFDGSGYPHQLAGENIPLLSRILAVAGSFVAMTSSCTYKSPKSIKEAISELRELSGSIYDPRVVNAFLDWLENENIVVKQSPPSPLACSAMGLAWVKDGKIYVQNPIEGGQKATVKPCAEVRLLVNGQPVTQNIQVSQDDIIEVIPLSYTVPGHAKVLISPDKMSAFIDIKNECMTTYELQDSPPTPNLVLRVKQKRKIVCPETTDSLMNLLKQHNISYGIDANAINDLVSSLKNGMVLVAKGLPPGQTIDDQVELPFEQKTNLPSSDDLTSNVDFKELGSIPSVSEGETLAIKTIGRKGEPGRTVTNQIVEAKEPVSISLMVGTGTEIVENGLKVVATTAGLPKVQKSGHTWIISVDPLLTIPGDVTVKTGNIRFKGDVNILGSVENDMSVSASGNISVAGLITKAKITAGGNVTVKGNIVNAEIISGGFNILCNNLKPLIEEFLKTLESLYVSANLMIEKLPPNSKVIFGNLLALLIEKRFTKFGNLLNQLQKILKQSDIKLLGSHEAVIRGVVNNLTGINLLQYKTPVEFQNTIADLTSFFHYINGLTMNRTVVNIYSAINSVIKSSGDVIVTSGCVNTNIFAEGTILVSGIVRGGTIQAQDNVSIRQIGSELGAKSLVMVAKDKKIRIVSAFDGVTVRVGKMSKTLEKPMKNIEVSLDTDGYLQIRNY